LAWLSDWKLGAYLGGLPKIVPARITSMATGGKVEGSHTPRQHGPPEHSVPHCRLAAVGDQEKLPDATHARSAPTTPPRSLATAFHAHRPQAPMRQQSAGMDRSDRREVLGTRAAPRPKAHVRLAVSLDAFVDVSTIVVVRLPNSCNQHMFLEEELYNGGFDGRDLAQMHFFNDGGVALCILAFAHASVARQFNACFDRRPMRFSVGVLNVCVLIKPSKAGIAPFSAGCGGLRL